MKKKNNKRKNDLKHLSRRELIDLICEMRKTNPSMDVPEIEEAEKEQRRLRRRAAYRQTFRGTVAGQIVVSVKNRQLKTGEIVAFWQGNKLLIKRVIAGPGQWVDIDANGVVTVDGETLDEPYLNEVSPGNCDIELPHQVAESHWFFMGDNRETSVDSRTASIGDISEDQIEGQIIFRIWPLQEAGRINAVIR